MEDLKKNVKMLEKKLDDNVELIINNMNRLHSHEELINTNANKIQENSYALEILRDIKQDNVNLSITNKRFFITLIVILIMWVATIGYLIYTLNDIGTIETTQEINAVDTINGNVVNNGDINGEH